MTIRYSFICPVFGEAHVANAKMLISNYWHWHVTKETELIFVENTHGESSLYNLDGLSRHIAQNIEGNFTKCALMNIGADAARGEFLIFQDVDIMLPQGLMTGIVEMATQFPAFTNWEHFAKISEEETELVLADPVRTNYGLNFFDSCPRLVKADCVLCGASTTMHRSVFEKCGGWNEKFRTWGDEDVEMGLRVLHVTGIDTGRRYLKNKAIHLYHPGTPGSMVPVAERDRTLAQRARSEPGKVVAELVAERNKRKHGGVA